jgi:phage terminase small subunit
MPVLKNARHERFAQNKAKGMSTGPAYTAAGYKATGHSAEVAGGRLLRNVEVKARIAELQGSTANQITDVRDFARQHTTAAIETLVSVMKDTTPPHTARVAASNAILDRGYGKAPQIIEADVSVYDSLSFEAKRILLAALDSLDDGEDGASDGPAPTTH